MAAAAEIIGEPLPEHWTYGVTADGRVFYIDDLNERTSWVHPVTNKPAASGLLSDPELPGGWEWSITPEGVLYYVDHNTQRTTFIHPLTKKAAPPFNDAAQSIESQRPSSLKPVPQQVNKRASGRQRVIDKGPEAQRMSNSKVILTGWLTVQELNSIRSWKRRWCVHADYGLFLYRDATEQQSVGSILLPSYTIRPCDASDPIHKRYAFKAEHANLRTQYFIAESKENMDEWVKVLNQSAQMLNSEPVLNNSTELQRPASPENDNDYYVLARDPEHNGELRYQRTNYGKEESLPEYYPNDGQSAASSKEYSPYSNIASPEFSHRNSFSPNHMSAAQPGSPPPLFHNQHHNSYGEAPHSRSSYSSVESPYNQRHDYNYQPMKPPERNSDSSPRSAHNRQSVSSSVGPYHEIASRYNISYSSLDFNAMYHHNGHAGEHPSPPGSYQSIGSPRSLDNANMTIPKSLEDGFYSSIPPSSQNNHSRHSLSSPHSSEVYQNHRNLSPLERGPNRDSYSSRGDQNPSQLSYEMYTHNGGHSGDSPNFDVSQDSFAMNHSDVAAPYSKRLYGAQTDLSKLVMDSDPGDQKSEDMESHHEYATICRIRSESMCTSPEIMRSRPNSISTSQHGSETEVPKRTSVQRLQEMHLRELQRHSPLSKSFSSGNVPNYHNISQTLSQDADHEDLEVAQSYIEGSNQQDPPSKRQSTSSLPQTEYQSENGALSPTSAPQNQIVYDYQGTGHDSTLPTQSSQGLSVKPHKYPNSTDLSMNDRTHNNYINVDNGHPYLDYVDKPYSPEFISADTSRDLHNMDYQAQSPSFDRNNHHISNDSLLDSQKPPSMDYKPMEPDPYNTRPASEISEPYINYQKAANLRSAAGTPTEKHRLQNEVRERNINTVKEDPNMPDTAVIETTHPLFAKLKASQGRLRMSISAGDLLGKTHEELVLLLIQLRRNKAHLEHCRESLRKQIDQLRPYEQEYKRQLRETNTILDFHLEDKHGHFLELKKQCGEVENKLEMYKPIENLVDNMVTMGSLYGGNNYMLATQYRKHILHPDEYIPPKKMLEFSRQHQEDAIIQKMERDVRELTDDEADLEEKLDRLCILDRLIQEQSFNVTSLREDKEALEKMLRDLHHEQNRPSDRSQQQMEHLANQQHTVDMELSRSMLQLAEASKKLEGLNAESSKLGHEIALLRSKVHGELSRSRSIPSLMGDPSHTLHKMEKDLYRVKDVMDNLNKEGARLSQALNTLKLPPETSEEMAASKKQKSSTYMETDLDSKESYDLACETSATLSPEISSNIHYYDGQVGFVKYVRPSSPGHFVNDHNSHSSPVLLESHKEQPLHSHLPAHFKAGGQEVGVAVPVTSTLEGDSYEDENMWDISDADDNTKRFFGLLPKERPRAQTVRDVKRQAEQRRERGANEKFRGRMSDESDREVELGDLWRALPPNTSTADYLGRTNSPPELIPHSSYKLDKSSEELLFSPSISQSLEYPDYNTLPQSPLQSPLPSPPPLPTSMLSYNNQNNHFTEGISSIASPPPLPPTSPPPLPPLPQLQQLSPIQVPTTSSMVTDPEFIRRRSSLHSLPQRLLGPKPFTPYNSTNNTMVPLLHNYEDKDLPVETVLPMKITETKNPEINEPSVSSSVQTKNLFTAKPWATGLSVPKLKRSPRGRNRYLTISSSEPIKLEHVLQRQSSIMSSAGDLIPGATLINNMPDIVKSSTIDKFDEDTIDRELMKPEMVFIPERYMPDSDEEDLTEEEKEKRKAKSEKIRKVLTEQSIHSWTKQFPAGHPEKIHDHIAKERIVREHLLTVTQELAKEVTKKSKAAAVERRKTWSGTPSSDYLKAVFGEKDLYAEDIMSG